MFSRQLFRHWTYRLFAPGALLRERYNAFQSLLKYDDICLSLIADLEEIAFGEERADPARITWLARRLGVAVGHMVEELARLAPARHMDLPEYLKKLDFYVRMGLDQPQPDLAPPFLLPLAEAAGRPDQAGGKAANLATVATKSGLPVPPGAVVTASAFSYFLEANELPPRLARLLRRVVLSQPAELARLCEEMQALVLAAEMPEEIARAVSEAAARLSPDGAPLAVRSSAVGEDGASSFAGQYDSALNVAPADAVAAYRRVLAGKYGPRAVTYRILAGLSDAATPMAALVMPMVPARAAGVVYTFNPPGEECRECSAVFAVSGLGDELVSGRRTPQVFRYNRDPEPGLLAAPDPRAAVLDRAAAAGLARAGLVLERLFGKPQDVEWALDARNRVAILQSRPIPDARVHDEAPTQGPACVLESADLLAEGLVRGSWGAACGPAFHARGRVEPEDAPLGAVLVTATLDPDLVRLVGRVAAVVSAAGSRASHFASVAREMGLPVVVAGPEAFADLPPGREVTVDATNGRIYAGRAEAVLAAAGQRKPPPGPALEQLRRTLPHISRLTLTDPQSPEFAPQHVKSMHDIVRFCHEKAVAEMFSLVGKAGSGLGKAKKLKSHLPLAMYVLDLEDGLFPTASDAAEITPNDFKSQPLWAFWYGLADPDVAWSDNLIHMDWEEFDRVSGGIFDPASKLLASYAVVSANYLHLMLRFGYHFSVVDSYCGPDEHKNYVAFRFKGGGGHAEGRRLRLLFLARVLGHFGFSVDIRGDMLDARHARRGEADTQKRLAELGYLLAITRLMDMGLTDETQVDALVQEFLDKRGAPAEFPE
ncbi:MAG: PEP/pyruvate-binding domain-containing protein [Thermodesulfobacteriota bacterium]